MWGVCSNIFKYNSSMNSLKSILKAVATDNQIRLVLLLYSRIVLIYRARNLKRGKWNHLRKFIREKECLKIVPRKSQWINSWMILNSTNQIMKRLLSKKTPSKQMMLNLNKKQQTARHWPKLRLCSVSRYPASCSLSGFLNEAFQYLAWLHFFFLFITLLKTNIF